MALFPTPHTDEWFQALEDFNPLQAAITRQIVKLAGRADVCSIRGDRPASDYMISVRTSLTVFCVKTSVTSVF